ncbi:SpoIIE family protein phosphatase, partial [candidate division CSSED10-310 bacterium]
DYSWLQTKESIVSLELRSIMCVPLKIVRFSTANVEETMFFSNTDSKGMSVSVGEIFGLVYVDNRVSNKTFTNIDLEILEALCSHASISIYNSRLIRDLDKSEKFSATLVDASKMLNSTLDLDELLKIIIELAVSTLDAEKSSLYLIDEENKVLRAQTTDEKLITEKHLPLDTGVAGRVVASGEIVNLKDPISVSEATRDNPKIYHKEIYSVLCVPLRDKENNIIGALETMNKEEGSFDVDDENMLEALSVHASLAIENAMLLKEVIEKRKLEQELSVAAEIQKNLLPGRAPSFQTFDVDALTIQCKHVGGDYYDFINLDENQLGVGKGIPAALMMANLQAILQSRALFETNPAQVVYAINHTIFRNSTANKYATLFYGCLDRKESSFFYTNAGHNPPLLRRNEGHWEELTTGGMVVGLFDKQEYEQARVELQAGDIIILFTDGVTEAMNALDEEYEVPRLKQAIENYKDKSAHDICALIHEEIKRFEAGTDRHDDLTLMVIKV